jgi:hypothetical protein
MPKIHSEIHAKTLSVKSQEIINSIYEFVKTEAKRTFIERLTLKL